MDRGQFLPMPEGKSKNLGMFLGKDNVEALRFARERVARDTGKANRKVWPHSQRLFHPYMPDLLHIYGGLSFLMILEFIETTTYSCTCQSCSHYSSAFHRALTLPLYPDSVTLHTDMFLSSGVFFSLLSPVSFPTWQVACNMQTQCVRLGLVPLTLAISA